MMRHYTPMLVLVVMVALALGGCYGSSFQDSAVGYRSSDASVPPSPHQATRWNAILIAGDHSIVAFDNAVVSLSQLLRGRGVNIAARFSAAGRVPGAAVATTANLDRWASGFRVGDGEGCLLFATSHGSIHGLFLSKEPYPSLLEPSRLARILTAACGDAPTVIVVSACHSGTFIRSALASPNRVLMSAARDNRSSFGCRPEGRYTFYDACLLQEFPGASTWEQLHAGIGRCIVGKEQRLREAASDPQAFFGRSMKDLRLP